MFLQGHSELERDDTGPFRVYRDDQGRIYHSVTHILKNTTDSDALERWKERMGERAGTISRVATTRGTRAHGRVEWRLKTARKLAINAANARGVRRISPGIWKWALARAYKSKPPKLDFSCAGYGRCLDEWVEQNCAGEAAVELKVTAVAEEGVGSGIAGWAGTFDAALFLKDRPGLWLVDWKTSATRRGGEMVWDYFDQLGAYRAGVLQHNPGVVFEGGAVVIARRAGPPDVHWLTGLELERRSESFAERFRRYCATTSPD